MSILNSLVGGLFDFGFDAARNAISYDQTKALARDQRKWEEEMWQKQFDATNEYNTPLAQKQRLDAAGLNGALLMTGQNAGLASGGTKPSSSIPSTPNMPSSTTVSDYVKQMSLQKKQQEFDTVLRDKEVQIKDETLRKMNEEVQALKIDNTYREKNILQDLGLKSESIRKMLFENDLNDRTRVQQVQQIYQQTEQSIIQTGTMRIEQAMLGTRYQNLPKQLKAEFNLMYAQTAAQYAAAYLANEQGKHEGYKTQLTQKMILKTAADTLKTNAEAFGIKLSNHKAFNIMGYEIERARLNSLPQNANERVYGNFKHDKYDRLSNAFDNLQIHVTPVSPFSFGR